MPKGSAHCTTPASSSSTRLVEWKPFRNECNKVSLFVKAFFVRHDAQYYKAHSNCAALCSNNMFPKGFMKVHLHDIAIRNELQALLI